MVDLALVEVEVLAAATLTATRQSIHSLGSRGFPVRQMVGREHSERVTNLWPDHLLSDVEECVMVGLGTPLW